MGIVSYIKNQGKIVATVVVASILGGVGTAAVLAAIPDSAGVIHACYSTGLLGKVKIIDSPSQSCGLGETPISWNQQGPKGNTGATGPQGPAGPSGSGGSDQLAYVHITADIDSVGTITNGVVDTGRSKNVSNVQFSTANLPDGSTFYDACITVSFEPKTASVMGGSGFTEQVATKNSGLNPENSGWSDATANQVCGKDGANAFVRGIGANTWLLFNS